MPSSQMSMTRLGDAWDPPFFEGNRAFFQFVNGVTTLIFVVLFISLCYTYGAVVGVLAMVEAPSSDPLANAPQPPAADEATDHDDTDDPARPLLSSDAPADLEAATTPPTFITSSMPATIRHLRARHGWSSRFRGLALFLILAFVAFWTWALFRTAIFYPGYWQENRVADILSGVLTSLALGGWLMAWTHQLLSAEPVVRWYRRIGQTRFRTVAKLVPATALWAFATQFTIWLPVGLYEALEIWRFYNPTWYMYSQLAGLYLFAFALLLFIATPATIILVRVQASLLPPDVETIIPLDRSFGGKTAPGATGDSDGNAAALGIFDAWESFEWMDRRRLALHYVKVFAMLSALVVVYVALSVVEELVMT